jgi:4,5-DOPA dioxygenase extradiol
MARMPVLFIGHGSPLNIILDNEYTRSLAALRRRLPKPEAILAVSAHWLTPGTFVTCQERPRIIHDFYGFPDELYAVQYPSPGAPRQAQFVTEMVKKKRIACSSSWGLDHASWAVLRHIYPEADIPVFEMSLAYTFNERHPKPLQYHYDLAKELADLRNRGVLVIGSGNIVHNLGMLDYENIGAPAFGWAEEFDEKVKDRLLVGDHEALIHFESLAPSSSDAVPTLDHYLPIIYIVSLQKNNEPVMFFHEGFQYGSVSMRCFQIG